MVAYCPKDGKSYETDGVIKYTIEYNLYENHKKMLPDQRGCAVWRF